MKNKDETARRIHRAIEICAHIIYWTGLIVMALLFLAAAAMLISVLMEPGEPEKALTAVGFSVVVIILVSIWVWAKIRRDPN
jgi:uncharacterized membrane protein required for colicin V production